MAWMEDDRMEIQFLMTGPANEANLYEILVRGTFDPNAHQMRYEQDARNGDGAEAVQKIHTDHEMDYLEPSMLGCFSAPWRCGRRGTRMRSRSSWRAQIDDLFGSRNPCTSAGAKKYQSRKNNDHWTEDEMIELVVGVSRRGIGKWSRVKDDYFSTSVRTSTHLKDKWRNLVAACKANTSRKAHKEKNTSKKKVSVQKATELVVKRFGHRILAMEANKHIDQKKK